MREEQLLPGMPSRNYVTRFRSLRNYMVTKGRD